MTRWLAVIACGATALALAAPVHADATDDTFVSLLQTEHVDLTGIPEIALVTAARRICSHLAAGASQADVYKETIGWSGWDRKSASFFVGAAQGTYCPNLAN